MPDPIGAQDNQHRPRLLVIDDQEDFCGDLTALLADSFEVRSVCDGETGLDHIRRSAPEAILLDIDLGPTDSGMDILLEIRKLDDPPPVIMLTGDHRVSTAVRAIKLGAYHYVSKPPDLEELTSIVLRGIGDHLVRRRLQFAEQDLQQLHGNLIFECDTMQRLLGKVAKVAPTEATVLITGESGTGKELIARRIHDQSKHRNGPFVAINCAAVPSDLIESEFFGHEVGAFTGATRLKRGKFEQAARGTLFLDEVNDSPLDLQVKLLRALEERTFCRVGGDVDLQADFRLVAATSKKPEDEVKKGTLREELYYRLNVFRLGLPPLRDRREDILPIANHYLTLFADKNIEGLSQAAQQFLVTAPWPGNVRELRNLIERGVINCEGRHIDIGDLSDVESASDQLTLTYEEAQKAALLRTKQDYVQGQLRGTKGNVSVAAERSGLSRQSFQRMIRELGLKADDYR